VELVSVADAFNGMVRGAIANRGVLVEVPDTDFLELVGSEVMSKMSLWAPGVQSIPTLNPGESPVLPTGRPFGRCGAHLGQM
jgi:hypothetical protein